MMMIVIIIVVDVAGLQLGAAAGRLEELLLLLLWVALVSRRMAMALMVVLTGRVHRPPFEFVACRL